METKPIPVKELSYEQAFEELEAIVTDLESQEHTLADALQQFERGQALAARCAALLDQAELKIQQVSGQELVPFNGE